MKDIRAERGRRKIRSKKVNTYTMPEHMDELRDIIAKVSLRLPRPEILLSCYHTYYDMFTSCASVEYLMIEYSTYHILASLSLGSCRAVVLE